MAGTDFREDRLGGGWNHSMINRCTTKDTKATSA
jgi:hypothetical protein